MVALHTFAAGTIARAEEVNNNFDYIMSILASMGAVDRLGELLIGPRGTGILTAQQDTGATADAFIQIGWNADWNKVGSKYVFQRIVDNAQATAIRLGANGMEVFTTDETTGNLDSQMKSVFHIKADKTTPNKSYVYLPPNFHFVNKNATPSDPQDYRLMYTPLTTPYAFYDSVAFGNKFTTTKSVYDWGIPTTAREVVIMAYVTATTASGAGFKMYQERASRNERYGFVVHAPIGTIGRAAGWGSVRIGEGEYAGKIVIETTYAFELVKAYAVGYFA